MNKSSKILAYVLLVLFAISMILPFYWMLLTSFKSRAEVLRFPPTFIPMEELTFYETAGQKYPVKVIGDQEGQLLVRFEDVKPEGMKSYAKLAPEEVQTSNRIRLVLANYVEAWKKVPFALYFVNTIYVAFSVLVGVIITSSLAAYAFARMKFWGRETIFMIFLSMMMVPQPVYLIPSYIVLSKLGWVDSYNALIIPWMANVFTIFLLRQHFKTIPNSLYEAAIIDGCSRFGFLWRIMLPLSKAVLVTAGIFSVLGSWNSFMWPLVVTNSPAKRVLQVGLSYFSLESGTDWTLLMAASTFVVAPLVVIFFVAQKQIISSFARSGLKD